MGVAEESAEGRSENMVALGGRDGEGIVAVDVLANGKVVAADASEVSAPFIGGSANPCDGDGCRC